jgi:hypothetical protein
MMAGVGSSSGLMALRCGTHKFSCFYMREMSHVRIAASSVVPLLPNPPPMTVEEKEKATTYYVPTFVQMRVLF